MFIYTKFLQTFKIFPHGVMVIALACHVGDPGSIPGSGILFSFFTITKIISPEKSQAIRH
mgnify:CR=1 FL=1